MQCSKCQHENPRTARFCMECGAPTQTACPSCGARAAAEAKFCIECGDTLAGQTKTEALPRLEQMQSELPSFIPEELARRMRVAEQEREGENRLVTAMFADISGFTPLSERLPTEIVVEKVNDCFKAVTDAVHRYEGSVNRFIGDCALAFFGAPISHENDPERAVRAALEMMDAVAEVGLSITVGINTGMMYFGPIGSKSHREVSAYGPDINLAKRLQETAQPGEIFIGPGTHRLTGKTFEFERLENQNFKGVKDTITAYRVVSVAEHPEKQRGIEGLHSRMVGREEEFSRITAAAEAFRAGEGQMVSIIGEAGIGKSRLVTELKHHLLEPHRSNGNPDDSVLLLEGRCLSMGQPVSYWPFLDILRSSFGLNQQDNNEELARKVREAVETLLPDRTEQLLPTLGRLLSIRFGAEQDEAASFLAADQLRLKTLSALRDMTVALAKRKPLLVVLEDLHWADDLSLELLSLLMDSLPTIPLMLLSLYRPERDQRAWELGELARSKCPDRYTEIELSQLTEEESRELVEGLLAIENFPDSARETILEKTEGNPFFIEEVIRSLIDEGMVYRHSGQWRAREGLSGIEVPDSVHSVVLARVDRLETEAKAVLQRASVIGRLFKHRLLDRMIPTNEPLEPRLDELEEKELIYEERRQPELEYSFQHAFTQEATYQGILNRRKRELHLQVAQSVESLYPDRLEENYEELAYHYSQSEDREKTLEYLIKAGGKAKQASAYSAAIDYLERALELLEELPETPDHAMQELAARIDLGFALMATKGYAHPGIGESYKRARELCEELGAVPHLLIVLYALFGWSIVCGRYEECLEYGREHQRLAEKLGETVFLIESQQAQAGPLYLMGEFDEARRHCEEGTRLYDPKAHHDRVKVIAQDAGTYLRVYRGVSLWHLGYPDQALKWVRDGLALSHELNHPLTLAHDLWAATFLFKFRGEREQAMECIEEMARVASDNGLALYSMAAPLWQGWSDALDGKVEEGIATIQGTWVHIEAAGMDMWTSFFLSVVAEILLGVNQIEPGLGTIEAALASMENTGERFVEAELYRLKGEFLRKLDRQDDAEASFERAIATARRQKAKSQELRAVVSVSRLWQDQGKTSEARERLTDIYEWFSEGFDTRDLKEAKSLIETLE